ncbi:MAG: GDSL-type esterase/lipase family protein [Coxiellaceae bacterium]|nr:GDSL-type esterase/lipase family protein [Coxiellaceae bacterium]
MKTILCYGDSNVRGVIPEKTKDRTQLVKVRIKSKRWTGLLQQKLRKNYDVVEEGMGGRSTMFDEILPNGAPGRPYRNGANDLPLFLEAHYPIDLVIFLLGLNDTKIQLNVSADKISDGMRKCVQIVKGSNKGVHGSAPKILIIAPFPIVLIPDLPDVCDKTSVEKSKLLPNLYQKVAMNEDCDFLDASLIVHASQIDGLHLDEDQHALLANAVAKKIIEIFSTEKSL